jgi:L-histidine N-alpha-methyltransferase
VTTLTVRRHLTSRDQQAALRADVVDGLGGRPKRLRPVWFYDARGSDLFEQITRLPEYYVTRAERQILAARATEIAAACGADTVVELGSGSSEKTRSLLDPLRAAGALRQYVAVDVSEESLLVAAHALRAEDPRLAVHAAVADFGRHLGELPRGRRCLVVFLGSTIGNLPPADRAGFLAAVRDFLRPGDALLLGTDLVKDVGVLLAAYDDAAGVTAEFNRNILRVLNNELNADFDPDAFDHVARWNAAHEWIELRLRSPRPQVVKVPGADLVVSFAAGEEILTEISAKFRPDGIRAELAAAGLTLTHWWTDAATRFGLSLSTPTPDGS